VELGDITNGPFKLKSRKPVGKRLISLSSNNPQVRWIKPELTLSRV
jgi:hypothetical protein